MTSPVAAPPSGDALDASQGPPVGNDRRAPAEGSPMKRRRSRPIRPAFSIGLGTAVIYLSLIVLIPLAAVVWTGTKGGWDTFWSAVSSPDAKSALVLTVSIAAVVTVVNCVMGTLIAWVLVRDRFVGRTAIDAIIDLPLVLPTIVAGLVLLSLYGPSSPVHVDLAYRRIGVGLALLFVTMPFVVRTVQPVLGELDKDMEQAAASLGASPWLTFRRIILPNIAPAIAAGAALAFTRAIAEFGATVLISGNIPLKTQVASVQIFGQIEGDNTPAAAAVSTVLLVVALVVLLLMSLVQRWAGRRD
ncbi:MAG: sulfate ABC transporter permease subunit CysT [Actinomycetales bacterium]